jgi:hypothetical protein
LRFSGAVLSTAASIALARGDGDLPLPNTVKEMIVTSQPRSIWRMSGQVGCPAAA